MSKRARFDDSDGSGSESESFSEEVLQSGCAIVAAPSLSSPYSANQSPIERPRVPRYTPIGSNERKRALKVGRMTKEALRKEKRKEELHSPKPANSNLPETFISPAYPDFVKKGKFSIWSFTM